MDKFSDAQTPKSSKNNVQESSEMFVEKPTRIQHGPHIDHPTNFVETLMHLLKGNIGSGLFAMGDAFKNSGLILGAFLTIILGIVCTHCQHILLLCAHKVKKISNLQQDPDFAETVELCFQNGPLKLRNCAHSFKIITNVFICLTQIGFCCVYFVFASFSLKQILSFHGFNITISLAMTFILLPVFLPCLITNLKYLAPFSGVANVCMSLGIIVVFYYLFQNLPNISERSYAGKWSTLPLYFGTAMFAFEGIALVLPLKNEMLKPGNFGKPLGVLNIGMVIIATLYTLFGFFGYLQYGEDVNGSITLNLNQEEILAQVIQILVAFGMCFTFPLQLFIAIQIIWPAIQNRFQILKTNLYYELGFRSLMVLVTFGIAQLVPHLNIFISLLGALCSTTLAILFPPLIQLILECGKSEGPSVFLILKNSSIMLVAFVGLLTGTYESVSAFIQVLDESDADTSDEFRILPRM